MQLLTGTTILLITTDEAYAVDRTAMLEGHGASVVRASSAEAAVEAVRRNASVHLAVLDADAIPGSPGPGEHGACTVLLQAIHAERNLPVVLSTSDPGSLCIPGKHAAAPDHSTGSPVVPKSAAELVFVQVIRMASELSAAHREVRAREQAAEETQQQLRQTIEELKTANEELRREEARRRASEERLSRALWEAREREKELACLFRLSELVEAYDPDLEPVFQGLIELIPASWQYPEVTVTQLRLDDGVWTSPGFRGAVSTETAGVRVHGKEIGSLTVGYARSLPQADEGPFLASEHRLLRALAERLGRVIERTRTQRELKRERFRLAATLDGTNVGTWEWNIQSGEARFNERWAQIIGYSLQELEPVSIDTWEKYLHPEDLPACNALLERHFRGETEFYECEARMRHQSGEWVWVLDRGKVAVWTEDGRPLWMYGTHQDITENKRQAERREQQLVERTRLMQELNHRVKNNLHMVSSLIALKDEALGNDVDLSDIQNQVETITALHERLSHHGTVSQIPIREYLEDILASVFSFFSASDVEVRLSVEEIELPTRTAVTLGLVTNELATNAIKYGFPGSPTRVFEVRLSRSESGEHMLTVMNSGRPFPEDVSMENPTTLGLRLVSALVQELRGTVRLQRKPATTFVIRFPAQAE
jgi:PAS domain S-box-containing protein